MSDKKKGVAEAKAGVGSFTPPDKGLEGVKTHTVAASFSGGIEFGSGVASGAAAPFYTVPRSDTKIGKERLRSYYEALGRFIDMFSQVETAITLTLRLYAKTSTEIAKVLFSGVKIELGSTHIKQLAAATNVAQKDQDDLSDVLQQLGIINGVRNGIIHFGASAIAEGKGVVSNALKAKTEPVVFPISPEALEEMTADLKKIAYHLNYNHLKRDQPKGAFGIDHLSTVLRSPWLYKYPSPPAK